MTTALLLLLLLALSAVFSGSETGFYSLSRLRLEAEARRGVAAAHLIRLVTRNDALFLITLLIGNNLTHELLTKTVDARISALGFVPGWAQEIVVALLLTPLVFYFAELLPKDLFRRRPRALLGASAPLLGLARVAFLPLALPLRLLSLGLEHALGVRDVELSRALGREQVLEVLQEGTRAGALPQRAQELALNVLELRQKTVRAVLVPWSAVERVELDHGEARARRRVLASGFTRVPATRRDEDGRERVEGYLLQLELLADELPGAEREPLERRVRPLLALPEDLPVERALARLRVAGQRIALVGEPGAPLGIVTLKDLVQTISGDLAGW